MESRMIDEQQHQDDRINVSGRKPKQLTGNGMSANWILSNIYNRYWALFALDLIRYRCAIVGSSGYNNSNNENNGTKHQINLIRKQVQ